MASPNHSALDAHIARIRELAKLGERSAPTVAQALERELAAQIDAGTGPDGKPWQPTRAGTSPLRGAAKAVRVRAIGSVVLATVEGHHALHHQGRARGGVRRQILPTGGAIPPTVERAVERAVTAEFRRTMGGAAR